MRTGPREDAELSCPFCKTPLYRPKELRLSQVETAMGGVCRSCGAIYLMDPTGKNVGEIMMQGMELAADRLTKKSFELVAGEDYDEVILNYDWRTHRSTGEARNYPDRGGRLYVIRIKGTKKD